MQAIAYDWTELPADNPIDLLDRWSLTTDQMLAARVFLHQGCVVKVHRHESEQIAMIMSGRVRWTLGEEGRIVETVGGQVVHLPSNVPHGVEALEDTLIFDILTPPGKMGVDSQID